MHEKAALEFSKILELQQRIAEFEDEVSYKKLFYHFFLPLKSFSFSILKSNEIAEEIVSDIFLDIWLKRKTLADIDNIKLYLFTSVRNNSIRKLQQINRSATFCLDNVMVEFTSTYETAEEKIENQEFFIKIAHAIDQLPQRCKLIFKLAKEDNLRYKEIAELLNISIKTIDSQISTAIKKISLALKIPSKNNLR